MKDHTCVTSRSNRTQADTPRAVSTNATPASRIGPTPASKLLTKRLRTAGWRTRARRASWPCVAGRRALHRERLERRPSHAMVSTGMSVFQCLTWPRHKRSMSVSWHFAYSCCPSGFGVKRPWVLISTYWPRRHKPGIVWGIYAARSRPPPCILFLDSSTARPLALVVVARLRYWSK
jgi:hypothetical protein